MGRTVSRRGGGKRRASSSDRIDRRGLTKHKSKLAPESIPIVKKVNHVLNAKQTRHHHCHWPGCTKQVPPAMWGCKYHWFLLPQHLRDRIWNEYVPGQEIDANPSVEYLAVAREIQDWIKRHHPDST